MHTAVRNSNKRGSRRPLRSAAHRLGLIGAAMLLATACSAAGSSGNIDAAQDLVDSAAAGQTIKLPAGTTGSLTITERHFASPVTIDMAGSNLSKIVIRRSSNVRITNGRVTGAGARDTFGIFIDDSQKVEISNVTVSKFAAGIAVRRSQDVLIANNIVTDLIADGIMIASAQRVKVYGNSCSNFHPVPKVFDDAGNMLEDGDHPDCIQGWSLPDYAPTSDLEVVGNRGFGNFQGVFLNNPMPGGGGYDRVVVTDNQMQIGWYHAIYMEDGRDVLITRNSVSGTGARDIRGKVFDRPIRPYITVSGGRNVKACGNTVADFPDGVGTARC